jgi:hypothetical protein
MGFMDKMERRFGKFAITGLMKYMVGCYIIGYVLMYTFPQSMSLLSLEPYFILHGQIWRLVSWLLIPPSTSIIWAVIMIIFYYQIGTALERTWGAFRFNVYIFGGIILTIVGAFIMYFIVGGAVMTAGLSTFSTYYINLSIFLAFAVTYPEHQVLVYFLIPVKMKWLAIIYAVLALYGAVVSGWPARVAIICSLGNFLIFWAMTRNLKKYSPREIHRKQDFKRKINQSSGYTSRNGTITKHKCAVCGRTELDDPNLEFRFCSRCNGNYEYCQDHLFTHEHVK